MLLIYIILLGVSVIIFQFRALADQLYHNPDYHKFVRKQVIKQVSFGLNSTSILRSKFQNIISQKFYLVNLPLHIQVLVLFKMQESSGESLLCYVTHFFASCDLFSLSYTLANNQLTRHRNLYESYVPMRYKDYVKKMKRFDV